MGERENGRMLEWENVHNFLSEVSKRSDANGTCGSHSIILQFLYSLIQKARPTKLAFMLSVAEVQVQIKLEEAGMANMVACFCRSWSMPLGGQRWYLCPMENPSTNLEFSRASIKNALALSLLADFSFRNTFIKDFRNRQDLDDYCQKTFAYAKIRNSLRQSNNHYLIARVDKEIVGYAKLKLGERPVQLQKIYLHPAFLRRGIGQAMLEESKNIARQAGATKLWLAVEEQNQNAIAFYERTGWNTTGEFDFQIGTQTFHFFRMELDL